MIASRSLFRPYLAWKVTCSCVIAEPSQYLQRGSLLHSWSYNLSTSPSKNVQSFMDQKKRKTVIQTWRPVSTQSSSHREYAVENATFEAESSDILVDGGNHELGCKVEETHKSIASSTTTVHHEVNKTGVGNEKPGRSSDSWRLQGCGESTSLREETTVPSERHLISVEVGASLMRFIKGRGGDTQRKIEEETGVKIIFPSSRKDDCVAIEGDSAESVNKASDKIQAIIEEAVKSPSLDYSHFISLPLAIHPELVDKLVDFQNSILGIVEVNHDDILDDDTNKDTSDEDQKDGEPIVAVELQAKDGNEHVRVDITSIPLVSYPPKSSKSSGSESKISKLSGLGIEKSIFIKPKTFHLTVLMLKLWNKGRVEAASEVLKSVSPKVINVLESRPVSIRLKGLDCMRGSLAKARVLYAPVEEIGGEDRLLHVCQIIIDAFVEAGLVLEKDANQKLKLHATVMNARHRKRNKGTRKVDYFDARGIFDQFGTEEWGEYLVREAHLSQRFAFDQNGYYHCCASIPFPANMQLDENSENDTVL